MVKLVFFHVACSTCPQMAWFPPPHHHICLLLPPTPRPTQSRLSSLSLSHPLLLSLFSRLPSPMIIDPKREGEREGVREVENCRLRRHLRILQIAKALKQSTKAAPTACVILQWLSPSGSVGMGVACWYSVYRII